MTSRYFLLKNWFLIGLTVRIANQRPFFGGNSLTSYFHLKSKPTLPLVTSNVLSELVQIFPNKLAKMKMKCVIFIYELLHNSMCICMTRKDTTEIMQYRVAQKNPSKFCIEIQNYKQQKIYLKEYQYFLFCYKLFSDSKIERLSNQKEFLQVDTLKIKMVKTIIYYQKSTLKKQYH